MYFNDYFKSTTRAEVVLRPSEKFSSSSKTSMWIFELSEFRARSLAFNFRAERVRAKTFRALKNTEQNPSEREQFFERKFRAFFAKSSEQKYFFRAHLKFLVKLSPFYKIGVHLLTYKSKATRYSIYPLVYNFYYKERNVDK